MHVQEETHGPLLHWEIHRPQRLNALGPTLGAELAAGLSQLAKKLRRETGPRLLYVTAAPNPQKVWIAGGDLKELSSLLLPSDARRYARLMTNVCHAFARLPIPVVMGLDGKVIGGGLEFALAGDMRLATPATSLDFRQLAIGLATAFGGAARLVKLVGLARATEWQLLCATLSAEEAATAGLVTRCLPTRAALFDQAMAWAKHFESLPFESVSTQKMMLTGEGRTPSRDQSAFSRLWRNPLHEKVLKRFAPSGKEPKE